LSVDPWASSTPAGGGGGILMVARINYQIV
jgi:hypothetical protein